MLEARDIAGVYHQLGPAQRVEVDGSVSAPGDTPHAQLMYSADGHYSFIVTPKRESTSGTDRPDLSELPIDELRASVTGVIVLAGRFEFRDGFLEHHVDFSLHPNLLGTKMVREAYVDLDGADFTLAVPPGPDGSQRRVHWRRAPMTA
jgi:lipocalin-like protein